MGKAKAEPEIETPNVNLIHQGGLMRCCIATIEEFVHVHEGLPTPAVGHILVCRYCADTMVLRADGWHWNRAEIPH